MIFFWHKNGKKICERFIYLVPFLNLSFRVYKNIYNTCLTKFITIHFESNAKSRCHPQNYAKSRFHFKTYVESRSHSQNHAKSRFHFKTNAKSCSNSQNHMKSRLQFKAKKRSCCHFQNHVNTQGKVISEIMLCNS